MVMGCINFHFEIRQYQYLDNIDAETEKVSKASNYFIFLKSLTHYISLTVTKNFLVLSILSMEFVVHSVVVSFVGLTLVAELEFFDEEGSREKLVLFVIRFVIGLIELSDTLGLVDVISLVINLKCKNIVHGYRNGVVSLLIWDLCL